MQMLAVICSVVIFLEVSPQKYYTVSQFLCKLREIPHKHILRCVEMKKSFLFVFLALFMFLAGCNARAGVDPDNILVDSYKIQTCDGSDLSRPQISGMADGVLQKRINARLSDVTQQPYDVIKKQNPLGKAFERFATHRHGDILTIVQDGEFESASAAHGTPYRNYISIGLMSGKFYSLKDLFNKEYERPLIDITAKHLQSQLGADWLSRSVPLGRANFMAEGDHLILVFSPYDVAAYATGFVEVKIPFVSIKDWLDPESEFFQEYYDT